MSDRIIYLACIFAVPIGTPTTPGAVDREEMDEEFV